MTVALAIYDRRNSELHDDLISRIRRLEAELGVHTGIMLGRLDHTRKYVTHGVATAIVYWATFLSWIGAAILTFTTALTR